MRNVLGAMRQPQIDDFAERLISAKAEAPEEWRASVRAFAQELKQRCIQNDEYARDLDISAQPWP